jgi:hypothetical protein
MNVAQWQQELERLRWAGRDSVEMTFWRGYVNRAKTERTGPRMRPSIKYLSPRERIEAVTGHELAKETQILRCGRRSYYVIEPDRGPHNRVHVY